MLLPLSVRFLRIFVRLAVTEHFIVQQYWALPPPMASGGRAGFGVS
jgi:hypothetical protein